jgi:hypothetical protein
MIVVAVVDWPANVFGVLVDTEALLVCCPLASAASCTVYVAVSPAYSGTVPREH